MAEKQSNQQTTSPYQTFQDVLNRLQPVIPNRIDSSVLPSGSWRWALQYLGLITSHGMPTEQLIKLVNSQGSERQELIRAFLKSSGDKLLEP